MLRAAKRYGQSMRDDSEGKEKPLLIIDGYNLIHSDEEMKELAGRDIGSVRDDLVGQTDQLRGIHGS